MTNCCPVIDTLDSSPQHILDSKPRQLRAQWGSTQDSRIHPGGNTLHGMLQVQMPLAPKPLEQQQPPLWQLLVQAWLVWRPERLQGQPQQYVSESLVRLCSNPTASDLGTV